MSSIASAFDKMAPLTGNASKFIRVNSGATGQEAVAASGTGNVVLTAGATLTAAALNGTIGSTTPAAGAFTTLAASGAVSGAGFSAYLASPPAIGGSAPAAGSFTTLAASGTLTPAALVDISGASAGQIKFPATANPSANANTLDDYEEGTWTPAITFQSAGNLAVTYSVQNGTYTKIGRKVFVEFQIATSSFTFTTSTGLARISGLPFAVGAGVSTYSGMIFGGITKAGYTQIAPGAVSGNSFLFITASGSGVAAANVDTADMPSGGTVLLYGQIQYDV